MVIIAVIVKYQNRNIVIYIKRLVNIILKVFLGYGELGMITTHSHYQASLWPSKEKREIKGVYVDYTQNTMVAMKLKLD